MLFCGAEFYSESVKIFIFEKKIIFGRRIEKLSSEVKQIATHRGGEEINNFFSNCFKFCLFKSKFWIGVANGIGGCPPPNPFSLNSTVGKTASPTAPSLSYAHGIHSFTQRHHIC